MTLQMLDVDEEISVIPTKDTKAEVMFRVPSSCSCPQCNSFDCFDIRFVKGNLLCTCLDCKDMYTKNDSSKKSDEGSDSEVAKKLQDDGQLYSLHTDTKSNLSSEKSDEACSHEPITKVVNEDGLNTKCDLPNKISESKMRLELTRRTVKEDAQKDELNAKIRHDLESKLNDKLMTKFNEDERDALNIQSKSELLNIKYNDQSFHKITKEVVKADKQNNLLNINTKHDSVNEISNLGDSYHDKFRKNLKDEEHKDPIQTCIKCGRLNKRNDGKQCCDINKKSDKAYEPKDELNKTVFSHKKIDRKIDRCCVNPKRGDMGYNQKDVSYREITRKITKEQEQKDTLKKHVKSEKSKVDLCEHTEFSYKDKTFIEDKVQKCERSYEESYTRNYSVAMTYTRKEEKTESEDPTATLSAQIMDLPYQDYKDSLSSYKPTNSLNTSKITKPDILAKLKEIYKACSCKICECIPGYSTNEVFKGDTCGCADTKHKYSNNTRRDTHITQREGMQVPHSGCACYRCDRKDCRGVWKNKTAKAICDCEPCECVKFSKSFTKPCDCEPCQCAECTALNFHTSRPVIVAPVQGHFQQNMCQCEPCECAHCTHNYGAMASNLMREASTGMATHRSCNCDTCENNSCQFDGLECRCTQSRIMRKPIDRSVRDYDLRRALVAENSFSRKRSVKIKNCDTIAMFAFSTNNYSNTAFNKFKDNCYCKDCECIICKNNEKYERNVKNSYEDIPLALTNVSDKPFSTCKCQPCECQMCCKDEAGSDTMQATRAVNDYGCDIFGCKHSSTELPYGSQNIGIHEYSEPSFKNEDSSMEVLQKLSNEVTIDFAAPLKKGKLLTPSMFEAKILSQRKFQSQSSLPIMMKPLPSKSILKVNSKKPNKKLLCPQNVKICHLKSINKSFDVCKQPSNKVLLSAYLNGSYIKTDPKHFDHAIENETIHYTKNEQKCSNNETPTTSIIFHKKPSVNYVDATINEVIHHNQSSMEENNKAKLLNSIPNFYRKSKGKRNSELDLFFSRIISFEKSMLQIQADILQSRKALAEICSKNGISHDNFSEYNTETSLHETVTGKASRHETNLTDPTEYYEIYKESDNIIEKSEKYNIEEMVNNTKAFVDSNCNLLKYEQKDNFRKGDNKTYTRLTNKFNFNVKKIRRNVTRSKVKKLLRNSENKIIDLISQQVKENYRHHGKNKLNLKYSTKSASTSHENLFVAEPQNLKFKDDNDHSQMLVESAALDALLNHNGASNAAEDTSASVEVWTLDDAPKLITRSNSSIDISEYQSDPVSWSVLRKNFYISHTPAVTHKGISTIPELELHTKCVVQSISLQTNETQGYAALTKLQTEVSNLLNSPLLHVKKYLKSDLSVTDEMNIDSKSKSKLDLELKHKMCSNVSSQTHKQMMLVDKEVNCDIGPAMEDTNNIQIMKKLVDLLLTRTVCKSELTKPFSSVPEKLEVPKINSVKSCESLKARFLGLRRVSDHTVLVRWRMPRQVEDVQGYELQVDGRPVQKILSPTRCMAVLTCLPHCEKLVLTVRTLTFSELPSDHHPAATIVYCPREKRPRSPRLSFTYEQ